MSRKDKNGWQPSNSDEIGSQETNVYLQNFSFLEEDNPAFLPDESFSNGLHTPEQISSCEFKPEVVGTNRISIVSVEKDYAAERSLIYSRHEKVPMKDFSKEIRGARDIERFTNRAILLLNMNVTSVDKIIEEILRAMVHINDIPALKSLLFTHDGVHQLRKTVQSSCIAMGGGFDYDQSWICSMCCSPIVTKTMVGIAHLRQPANFGTTAQEISFVIIIITPTKEKGTKSEFEIGRTFSTLFACPDLRQELSLCSNSAQFNNVLRKYGNILAEQHRKTQMHPETEQKEECKCGFMRGLRKDLKRRLPHYISDYKDGVIGPRSVQKTLSTTLFLYFAILLPSIAFGVLNDGNTKGTLNVEKVIYSQIFGGLVFALFGGTPQIVLLTTAPLALYTKIIYSICEDFDIDFPAMFGCVGLWNTFFLFIYSFFDLSILMQWSTRSSEEIFALFIAIAFTVDSFKSCAQNFDSFYNIQCPDSNISSNLTNGLETCAPEKSVLYLFLLLATLWVGVSLFNFKNTPYLTSAKREMFSDYALPASVIIMSFVGAYLFRDIKLGESFDPDTMDTSINLVPFSKLNAGAVFGGMGLGFCLSLLFFMDQNISAALVNAPQNKMKKGTAYHWDLFVVGVINGVLSLFAFPWLHAALPHSPLHVLALADVEERVDQGHVYQTIVNVRETRLTAIFSHILIGLSLLILNYLAYIPNPVLYGLFLFVAVTSLYDNQLFERFCLLFTEQSAYPPNHYIRQVPQRKMHLFTGLQVLQLVILCVFGFVPYPYLKMFFPVLIFGLIPVRHKIIPYIINDNFLKAMDGN
ncbi:solute carrier family 4 member 11 [Octopus bimaculoides]|uniref:Bicarbonate transporter-like transmembrane domain-containing protein n=1 Tax=Octopus bimaculoides TaxID=37653 RepID=A0A0L8IBK8_OCTBM|nr:solute carrier family 4 member 11 [Octopus bimaculoides]XP_014779815.1 solute carrier family 4 member 11 [Octopus bimaculoides]|eukprot:XP_014779810.1 PREDICTED: sodium bicarbonate transporter-like protein 11 [Octopus bimaculoides]